MRRDQVLKICLNHILTSDIEYLPKDDKTWLFSAPDYSEGEINHWQFCLRFKTAEIAQDFKKAVDSSVKKSAGGPGKMRTNFKHIVNMNNTVFYGTSLVFIGLTVFVVCYKRAHH